jgi:hypothetical protein
LGDSISITVLATGFAVKDDVDNMATSYTQSRKLNDVVRPKLKVVEVKEPPPAPEPVQLLTQKIEEIPDFLRNLKKRK